MNDPVHLQTEVHDADPSALTLPLDSPSDLPKTAGALDQRPLFGVLCEVGLKLRQGVDANESCDALGEDLGLNECEESVHTIYLTMYNSWIRFQAQELFSVCPSSWV